MTPEHHDRLSRALLDDLGRWVPRSPDQDALRSDYLRFLTRDPAAAVDREHGRAHVTGSAFVFTPDLRHVLLCFHRKAGFWLQLGGHVEPADTSVQAAAQREAQEEGGILELTVLGDGLIDLDRHDLGAGFTRCDTHWDVGYGFLAEGDPIVSDESEAVEWWPLDALPKDVPDTFETRLSRAAWSARSVMDPTTRR